MAINFVCRGQRNALGRSSVALVSARSLLYCPPWNTRPLDAAAPPLTSDPMRRVASVGSGWRCWRSRQAAAPGVMKGRGSSPAPSRVRAACRPSLAAVHPTAFRRRRASARLRPVTSRAAAPSARRRAAATECSPTTRRATTATASAGTAAATMPVKSDPGFSCASPGQACREIARCGDGVVASSERCDDANPTSEDGCSSAAGSSSARSARASPACAPTPSAATPSWRAPRAATTATTRRSTAARRSACASRTARANPAPPTAATAWSSTRAATTATLVDGDGCSATCTVENGFTCKQQAALRRSQRPVRAARARHLP